MIRSVVTIDKPLGRTPLQAVWAFKRAYPEYRDEKIGYAGRLDPMAEGLLLLLVGEENKKRKAYEDLPKTYEFSVLLGVATDTYDLMGMITANSTQQPAISTDKIKKVLGIFTGEQSIPYPPYSSRTVNGVPLYKYARENRLSEIKIPIKQVTISSFELLSPHPQRSRVDEAGGSSLLPSSHLLSHISRIIPSVKGDFRQDEIVKKWSDSSLLFPTTFPKFDFRITCSSGTYVRGIVHELGERLGLPAVTYSIKRTKIGEYTLRDAMIIGCR